MLEHWTKRWIVAVAAGLAVILAAAVWLAADRPRSEPDRLVINQIRLQVNDIILYLERHAEEALASAATATTDTIETSTAALTDSDAVQLSELSEAAAVRLMVADLGGNILYRSADIEQSGPLDLRTSLHYDLHDARTADGGYRIAFPIVGDSSNRLIGHAVFMLPAEAGAKPAPPSIGMPHILAGSALFVALLAAAMYVKLNRSMLQPARRLKGYSEAILKGNYEQQAQHGQPDEMGELYAVFDQMRIEIKHLEERRRQQDQAQKELISNISHELKTPLATVKAYLEAMQEGVCPDMESMLDYARIMGGHTDKMTRLIEDLLLHALSELGQISVELKEQYSKELFEQILEPLGHHVRTAGVTYIGPRDVPNRLIKADAFRLEQVIANLISNALKHTTAGDAITVEIRPDDTSLTVTIADTGEGIEPSDMPFLFERYYRGKALEGEAASPVRGDGLGLSICKHIIDAHRGNISFRSIRGEGTTFSFTIPLC